MDENSDAARGRRVLLTLIIVVLVVDAGISTLWLSRMPHSFDSPRGQVELIKRGGRFLVTLLLMLLVYRGNSIAVVISIGLFSLAALMLIPSFLEVPFLFPLLALYTVFPLTLMFSEDVGAFLEQQRTRGRSSPDLANQPPA
jgi:hypothetical protein